MQPLESFGKPGFLKFFSKFHRKAPLLEPTLFNINVFLWNFKIFKSTYFEEHLRTTATKSKTKRDDSFLTVRYLLNGNHIDWTAAQMVVEFFFM